MTLNGTVVAADSTAKTITIECEKCISGVIIGEKVTLTENSTFTQESQEDAAARFRQERQPYKTGGLI